MSNKERAMQLIESLSEYKMGFAVAYLQGLCAAEEAEDEMYCQNLYRDYLNDAEPDKHDTVSIEALASDLGVEL